MELTPYLEGLRRDLNAAAAAGRAEVVRAADLLGGSLESSVRLCLLEALSDAAAEITTRLEHGAVELRLRGREAEFVVTESEPVPPPQPAPAAPPDESGDITRITLRLPESLKEAVESAAAAEGISVNAWLVRAIAQILTRGSSFPPPPPGPPFPPVPPIPPIPPFPPDRPGRGRRGRRMTGYAEA